MKYCFLILALSILSSCCAEKKMEIAVKNPTGQQRTDETVQIGWEKLSSALRGISATNVVVFDAAGKEIPSQVIYNGETEPQALIFQTTVAPDAVAAYQVKTGQPAVYKKQTYGRLIPERKDDYAWENNLVGHRMYGPALEATGEISNGIDTWVKCTEELLIDEWYKTGNYHKNHGKGMDCYKVGRTLGSGAMAPYIDGKMVLANNYVSHQTLDDGPLRTSFKLVYAPFKAGGADVTETRVISLDANSRFNRIQETYAGAQDMEVVAGIVTRKQAGDTLMNIAAGVMGYWEPQNNDNGDNNGHIGIGIVMPDGAKNMMAQDGHFMTITDYQAGKPLTYYMGTAWSMGGVESAAVWFDLINAEKEKIANPLIVEIRNK